MAQGDGRILVNGETVDGAGATLKELISGRGIDPARRGLAVALNGRVVSRVSWGETRLVPGDRVEIVQALAGG